MSTDRTTRYRRVNRLLGARPKIGGLPADQLFPLLCIIVASLIARKVFGLSWIGAAFVFGWLMGTSWLVTGSRSWRWLSRFADPPQFIRGGARYVPLLPKSKRRSR